MGRAPCCEKVGLKRGRWTAEEDEILTKYIQANGEGSWRSLPKNAGLLRCGKSCRLRWINYLRSDLKRGNISSEEEEIIIRLHASLGNRWSLIAGHLSGRTDNEIKNYWNSHLSRKLPFSRRPPSVGHDGSTLPAAAAATTDLAKPKRRGGRTSRSVMKKNKTYNIPTKKVQSSSPSNQLPREKVLNSAINAVHMPSTPILEKETLSSPLLWPEENIIDVLECDSPGQPSPMEVGPTKLTRDTITSGLETGILNQEDLMAGGELDNMILDGVNDEKTSSANDSYLNEWEKWQMWDDIDGNNNNNNKIWTEESNMLPWLWDSTTVNGERVQENSVLATEVESKNPREMDSKQQSAVIAWLLS